MLGNVITGTGENATLPHFKTDIIFITLRSAFPGIIVSRWQNVIFGF